MPPPKIIGQVLQEKKDIVKEIQRRKRKKKQCSQRKKRLFFVWNTGCLHNKVFPWGSPEGQKKEQSHLPCQVQTCPTGATKGQLISKSLFAVIVSTKLATKIL